MRRPIVLVVLFGAGACYALWLFLQTPGSLDEVLSHPLHTLQGTQEQLNTTLLEVSETAEPVRTAGRRLLKPLGMVRLVRTYDASDSSTTQKH